MTMPFIAAHAVPVRGGMLYVASAGPAPAAAASVVLAVHGITASHVAWRAAVRDLAASGNVAVLAPDLRGRGRSGRLPPPRGLRDHVDDLVAVLDHFGVRRALLAGHSMGAYLVARLAADHPERVAGVVLIDGGLPVSPRTDVDPDEVLEQTLGPALARLDMTFASAEHYVDFWRAHPAFQTEWSEDLEAYVRADLAGGPEEWRSVTSAPAVRADGAALLADEVTLSAAERIDAPLHVLRAPRGLLDDDRVVVPDSLLESFLAARPAARGELVEDVNHYTILMGTGAPRVAAAIRAVVPGRG
jgi:pimeloyl-ACP methyl ester carboxylesterase